MVAVRSRPLSDHDSVLGAVLKAHAESPPRIAALAVTVRGLTAGIPPGTIRLWLRSRGGTRLDNITATPRSYQPVLAAARAKRAAVSSAAGRQKVAVAISRRLVGCLLSPVDVPGMSAHRVATARHALAAIGLDLLRDVGERGFDTALVGAPWLAVQMGCREPAARSALSTCVELGWLRVVTRRRGSASRYKFRTLPATRGDVALEHALVVDALAHGEPLADPTAELIALAAHQAVGYGLGWKALLVQIADQAGVDPIDLGVGKRAVPGLRREWLRMLTEYTTDDVDVPLADVLDRAAEATGATARRAIAEEARRAKAGARADEVERHREQQRRVNAALDRLLDCSPIPRPDVDRDGHLEWAGELRDAIAANDLDEEIRRALARALAGRMRRRDWQADRAKKVADRVCGMDQPPAAEPAA